MNSNNKTNALDKALDLISSRFKRNPKHRIHDKVRDHLIDNLNIINKELRFVEKELRVFGGYIDIVAKDDKYYYLIELKTRLEKYSNIDKKWWAKQLLKQKKGLKHIVSLFTNKELNVKLILVEYIKDTKKVLVKSVDDTGNITKLKESSF